MPRGGALISITYCSVCKWVPEALSTDIHPQRNVWVLLGFSIAAKPLSSIRGTLALVDPSLLIHQGSTHDSTQNSGAGVSGV